MKGNNVGPAAGYTGNMGKGSNNADPGSGPSAGPSQGGGQRVYSPKPNDGVQGGVNMPNKKASVDVGGVLPTKK